MDCRDADRPELASVDVVRGGGCSRPSTKAKTVQFTRGASALAATALLVTGLSACGDDPDEPPITLSSSSDDSTSSSSSSSSSSSASSSSTSSDVDLPDDIPAAALENTKAGAAAFGEYYYLKFGEATHTGKTTDIKKLGASNCKICSNSVTSIEADAAKGWTRSENPYSMSNVKAQKRPDEGYKVSMDVKVSAHKREDASGKENGHIKATAYTLTEHVIWQSGRWQVKDWIVT